MTKENVSSFPNWAKTVLVLLLIIVAGQSWWMYRLTSSSPTRLAALSEQAACPKGDAISNRSAPAAPDMDDPAQSMSPFDADHWDPFQEMQRMRDQMDQIFGEAFGRFERSDRFGALLDPSLMQMPHIDIEDNDDAYEISVDLPGSDDSEINTQLNGQSLTIQAKTDFQNEERQDKNGGQMLRRERRTGQFQRTINLPSPVDPAGMTSHYENGVLRIHVPKQK